MGSPSGCTLTKFHFHGCIIVRSCPKLISQATHLGETLVPRAGGCRGGLRKRGRSRGGRQCRNQGGGHIVEQPFPTVTATGRCDDDNRHYNNNHRCNDSSPTSTEPLFLLFGLMIHNLGFGMINEFGFDCVWFGLNGHVQDIGLVFLLLFRNEGIVFDFVPLIIYRGIGIGWCR